MTLNLAPLAEHRKFDAAEFNNLRMKPFGAAQRAGDRSTLVVWHSQLVTTAGTGKNRQNFAPSVGWFGTGELLKAFQISTQEHPHLQVWATNVT